MPTIDKVQLYKQNPQTISFEVSKIMALQDHLSFLEKPLLAYQNPNATKQDSLDNQSEETVSLCDLPIYGCDTNYNVADSEDSMIGDESFAFFSEESVKRVKDSNLNESIVFFGNMILPNQPVSQNTQESNKRNHGSTKIDLSSGSGKNIEFTKFRPVNKGRTHGHETKKMVASRSTKSRWYYYGVGLAGIPAEMDLSAIRSRQNRRQQNSPARTQGGCEKEESGGLRHVKGLGRLIRDLSCNSQTQANTMVKASLVCIPRVG